MLVSEHAGINADSCWSRLTGTLTFNRHNSPSAFAAEITEFSLCGGLAVPTSRSNSSHFCMDRSSIIYPSSA